MSSDTGHIFVPRMRRVHDRNLNSRLISVRAGLRTDLDNDLFSASLLHHLGFNDPGIRKNFLLELSYLKSYSDVGTERFKVHMKQNFRMCFLPKIANSIFLTHNDK